MKPDNYSYSQLSTFLYCGKQYQLSRLLGVRGGPTTWLVVGNAMHSAIEQMNRDHWERTRSNG